LSIVRKDIPPLVLSPAPAVVVWKGDSEGRGEMEKAKMSIVYVGLNKSVIPSGTPTVVLCQ
jgi:hypothetical protein